MSMSEQLPPTAWEMKVSWNGSEMELQHLQQRIELPLVEKDGITSLPIEGFDREHSPALVQREAEDQLDCLNGALRLEGINGFFSPSGLRRNEPDGKSTQYVFLEGACSIGVTMSAWFTCYDKDGNLIPEPPIQPKPLTGAATQNPLVRQVLGLVSKIENEDWSTLYKIVEIILASGAPIKEWGLKKTLDKVTSVANNPEAIGHKARHAVTKGTGSQVRMTFDQARAHVFKAVQKWIAHERDKPDAKNTDEQ